MSSSEENPTDNVFLQLVNDLLNGGKSHWLIFNFNTMKIGYNGLKGTMVQTRSGKVYAIDDDLNFRDASEEWSRMQNL